MLLKFSVVLSSSRFTKKSKVPARFRKGLRPEGDKALPDPFVEVVDAISRVSIGFLLAAEAAEDALSTAELSKALPAMLPKDPPQKSSDESLGLLAGILAATAVTFDAIGGEKLDGKEGSF